MGLFLSECECRVCDLVSRDASNVVARTNHTRSTVSSSLLFLVVSQQTSVHLYPAPYSSHCFFESLSSGMVGKQRGLL